MLDGMEPYEGRCLTETTSAQNYSSMWKQVKTAQDKDLPKTEYELLTQIADKAAVLTPAVAQALTPTARTTTSR